MELQPSANLPERIEPVYQCEQANEPFQLFQGQATLIDPQTDARYEGDASLTLEWLPNPDLVFRFRSGEPIGHAVNNSLSNKSRLSVECEIMNHHIGMKILPTQLQIQLGEGQGTWLKGVVVEPEPFIVGAAQTLDYAILHLVNFHNYVGSPVRDKSGQSGNAGRMELHTPGWRITIDQLPQISELESQMRAGGYAIAHVARVERADGKPFRPAQLQNLLEPLGLFLSFVRGSWSTPVLVVGYTNQQGRVWEQWTTPDMFRIPFRAAVSSWFPSQRPYEIRDLFARFCERWVDREWREVLRVAIIYYLAANESDGNWEIKLVVAQSALELLAHTVLVEQENALSEKGFEPLSASDKIRLLQMWAKLPKGIPDTLGTLQDAARKEKWGDGAEAITQLRNLFTHPNKQRIRRYFEASEGVAWAVCQLALLYIELVLLRLLGYQGVYYDRIEHKWAGEVKPVPWAGENRPE
jgi:hypothetical protein